MIVGKHRSGRKPSKTLLQLSSLAILCATLSLSDVNLAAEDVVLDTAGNASTDSAIDSGTNAATATETETETDSETDSDSDTSLDTAITKAGSASGRDGRLEFWSSSAGRDQSEIIKTLPEAYQDLPELVSFINSLLSFASPLLLRTEVDDGPLFDPETNEIWLPVSFAEGIAAMFADGAEIFDQHEQQQIINDVVLHTLVHEVGHALFAEDVLPLLAREEDAVDALASVLLLEYHERGDDLVLNAAEMFGLESDSIEWFEDADFWDEHSLDIQRYYSTLCHVYGSDEDSHEDLIDPDYGLSAERAESCIYEYDQLRRGWLSVLDGILLQ